MQRPAVLTLCAVLALAVVCLGSVGLLTPSVGTPSLPAPASLLLVVPILMSEGWGLSAFVLWPLAFLAWAHPLLRGSPRFPFRTFVLWLVVLLSSSAWFTGSWQLGLRYQGAVFTWGCFGLSLLLSAGALLLGLSCRRKPSFPRNLAAHWLLFAWTVTYAFPYLGETPQVDRFGYLPFGLSGSLREELEGRAERVLDARRLEDVFKAPASGRPDAGE